MLGKLFKYEWKSTARWMLPAYIFVILLSVINAAFTVFNFENIEGAFAEVLLNTVSGLCLMLFGISIVLLGLITMLVAVTRFYKNLLSNEGYISLTLPVSIDRHLFVKIATSVGWMIVSGFVVVLAAVIIAAPTGDLREIVNGFKELWKLLGNRSMYYALIISLNLLFGVVMGVNMCYFSMALGQLSNKHKIGMAIVAYIGLSFAEQIIGSIFMAGYITNVVVWTNTYDVNEVVNAFLWIVMASSAVMSAVYYFGTRYILKKKINLQ